MAAADPSTPVLQFSKRWHLLGPFRIGTREAIWGANPLEAYGAFHSLPVDYEADFYSSLGTNGVVKWSVIENVLDDHGASNGVCPLIELTFTFPVVDWAFQQSVYGWAALQYQAFTRGFITLAAPSACRVAMFTDNVLEFAVNDKPLFGGDLYGFRRAPVVLDLVPGANKIDIRLIRDVRSMGGMERPSISIGLGVQLCTTVLKIVEKSAVLPDVINAKLASPYASVLLRNETKDWIQVTAVRSGNESAGVSLLRSSPLSLAPGQSRPTGLWFNSRCVDVAEGVNISFAYEIAGYQSEHATGLFKLEFRQRSIQCPHKYTFLHPSGAVSYAILRPPPQKFVKDALPVLLNLHGAGLEADSHQVSHMLDAIPSLDAWVVFPTGLSPWSGDDWHVWGLADVSAAVSAIPEWIGNMQWTGPGVDTGRWIVTGHSNGGQGSWFISSHQPDKVVATAAVSGYSSIQNYVPYTMWREASPLVDSIIQNSLSGYRHELMVENLRGISVYQQHGGNDDNVPAYHSRLMSRLLFESGSPSQYVELPKRGHWFEGAMTTQTLREFYAAVLGSKPLERPVPGDFEFIIPNSGDVGSRAGIFIDQLQSPDICGRLSVHCDMETHIWHIRTSNIHRMHFRLHPSGTRCAKAFSIDETLIRVPSGSGDGGELAIVRCGESWVICDAHDWKVVSARFGRQRGCLDAILRTEASFKLQICSDRALEAALQVSRNLTQYFGADTQIDSIEGKSAPSDTGNVITLFIGKTVTPSRLSNFPIQIGPDGIQIRRPHTTVVKSIPFQPGLGAAFLRPLLDENLELVLWGWDEGGLQQAVRMVPTLTGTGQPDFIILGNNARWKGHAGSLSLGFFDHAWQISQASYVP